MLIVSFLFLIQLPYILIRQGSAVDSRPAEPHIGEAAEGHFGISPDVPGHLRLLQFAGHLDLLHQLPIEIDIQTMEPAYGKKVYNMRPDALKMKPKRKK